MVAQLRFAHKWRLINDSSQEIGKFVDIEGFWRLYNHLPALQPTGAHLGFRINGKPVVSISLFRDFYAPTWESFSSGGILDVNFCGTVDEAWQKLCQLVISGGDFATVEDSENCVGVRVVSKATFKRIHAKIELWLLRPASKALQECLKRALGGASSRQFRFTTYTEKMKWRK